MSDKLTELIMSDYLSIIHSKKNNSSWILLIIYFLHWGPGNYLLFSTGQICSSDILLKISFSKHHHSSHFHPDICGCFGDHFHQKMLLFWPPNCHSDTNSWKVNRGRLTFTQEELLIIVFGRSTKKICKKKLFATWC